MSSTKEVPCELQSVWKPSERLKLNQYCTATCKTTGRRCKNKASYLSPGAFLVMEVDSCCYVCGIHAIIANKKLKVIQYKIGYKLFEKMIWGAMDFEQQQACKVAENFIDHDKCNSVKLKPEMVSVAKNIIHNTKTQYRKKKKK